MNTLLLLSIPVVYYIIKNQKKSSSNKKVDKYLDQNISNMIYSLCSKYNFNFPEYVKAMVMVESFGDTNAVGSIGERGLLQLSQTAIDDLNEMYSDINFEMSDMFIESANLKAGILFLKLQYNRVSKKGYGIEMAVKAYNAGERGAIDLGRGNDYLAKVKEWL